MTPKQFKIPAAIVGSVIIALTGGAFSWAATTDNKVNTLEVQQGHDTQFRKDTTKQLEALNAQQANLNTQQATTNERLNWVVRALSNNGVQP